MMLATQILVAFGVGMIIYAIFGIFTSGKNQPLTLSPPPEDPGKEQKIQRLESRVA